MPINLVTVYKKLTSPKNNDQPKPIETLSDCQYSALPIHRSSPEKKVLISPMYPRSGHMNGHGIYRLNSFTASPRFC